VSSFLGRERTLWSHAHQHQPSGPAFYLKNCQIYPTGTWPNPGRSDSASLELCRATQREAAHSAPDPQTLARNIGMVSLLIPGLQVLNPRLPCIGLSGSSAHPAPPSQSRRTGAGLLVESLYSESSKGLWEQEANAYTLGCQVRRTAPIRLHQNPVHHREGCHTH
jgi:hypothetical protein